MSNNKSEIYAMGYEKWEGQRNRALPPFYLIGAQSLNNLVSSSGCFGRLIFGAFFIIYYFWMVLASLAHFQWENLQRFELFKAVASFVEQGGMQITEADYHQFWVLYPSLFFTASAMLFYGAQLISKDKRANAMQVYFSKAISRFDYVLGKYFAVGIITASVTLVPSAIILIMGVFLATDHLAFFSNSWYIPLLTGAYWLVLTLTLGTLTLMFSSFYTKSYMAGVSIIGFLVFFSVFALLMTSVIGAGDMMRGTNWFNSIREVGTVIYALEIKDGSRFFWQVIDLSALVGVCFALIMRSIRPVEVVS